ncbi:unnamed protein product, partial [Gordionus sp. m RMFG-2023]
MIKEITPKPSCAGKGIFKNNIFNVSKQCTALACLERTPTNQASLDIIHSETPTNQTLLDIIHSGTPTNQRKFKICYL